MRLADDGVSPHAGMRRSQGGVKPFVYTPVAYTVVPPNPACENGVAVALSPEGDEYCADQVLLTVAEGYTNSVRRAVAALGFRVIREASFESIPTILVLVQVPAGAAPDAARVLAKLDGVEEAGLNHIAIAP
jgi:hypothetical protein